MSVIGKILGGETGKRLAYGMIAAFSGTGLLIKGKQYLDWKTDKTKMVKKESLSKRELKELEQLKKEQ